MKCSMRVLEYTLKLWILWLYIKIRGIFKRNSIKIYKKAISIQLSCEEKAQYFTDCESMYFTHTHKKAKQTKKLIPSLHFLQFGPLTGECRKLGREKQDHRHAEKTSFNLYVSLWLVLIWGLDFGPALAYYSTSKTWCFWSSSTKKVFLIILVKKPSGKHLNTMHSVSFSAG